MRRRDFRPRVQQLVSLHHDRLFRAVFVDIGEAQALLRSIVPRELAERLDWKTLKLMEGSVVDEALKETHTDLLFEVVRRDLRKPVWLYVLLEHQSTPDPRMALRLLTYACRIWNAGNPDNSTELRPIFPVVVYQGSRPWSHSQEFSDQFPEADGTEWWLPRFRFHLLDQTGLGPEEVKGGVKGRITGQLLMAAFGQHRERALESARRSMTQLPPGPEVLYYLELFVRYVAGTQDDAVTREFAEVLRAHGRDPEGFIMSFAQERFEEGMAKGHAEGVAKGRAEGEQLGRMKAVEGFLQNGATWDLIEKATGLNEAEFRALKERLS